MSYEGDGFLTYERLREVYERCARPATGPALMNRATVLSWLQEHTFDVPALSKERESVIRMLLSLPAGFRVDSKGGGASVIDAARRGDGEFWTGDHRDVDRLIALGMASGLVEFCQPDRAKWPSLPGQLPYIRIEITRTGVRIN